MTANVSESVSTAPRPLVSEGRAKWLGIPLMTLFAGGMTALAIYEMGRILLRAAVLGVDVYVFLAVMYFWLSRSWKGGVTIKEVFYNFFWFLGLRKLVRSVRKNGISHASGLHIDARTDRTWKVLSAKAAIIIGLILTVVSLTLIPVLVIIHAFHLAVAMIWFGVAVWCLCDAVYYLCGRLWDDGFSGLELFLTIFGGPFAVAVRTVKAVRHRHHLEVESAARRAAEAVRAIS